MTPLEAHRIAVERIEQARAEEAWLLDLGDLPLEELPEELGTLTGLRVLSLGKYALKETGEDSKGLIKVYADKVERRTYWTYDPFRPDQLCTDLRVCEPFDVRTGDFAFHGGGGDLDDGAPAGSARSLALKPSPMPVA